MEFYQYCMEGVVKSLRCSTAKHPVRNEQYVIEHCHVAIGSHFGAMDIRVVLAAYGSTGKYNESRLVDQARFNDETGNENHNDEIINDESIPIYSFIVLKIFIYDGLSRGNCCYCEHIKDGPCFNGATSAQNC
ncbi:hypothetical protein TNCV_4593371 [Trichonephila clavipes]|uniref:Uncharacterized protein n=1 Tax=Trichonephila clavipes TaxID=2585209 RepID=A0A8X6WF26_TRICX|nr:hypothetical protein TNCV_4593371 [Trichonephila clavipes]